MYVSEIDKKPALKDFYKENMIANIHFNPTAEQSEAIRMDYFKQNILKEIQANKQTEKSFKLLDIGCSQDDFETESKDLEAFGLDIEDSNYYDSNHFKKVDLNNAKLPYDDETFNFIVAGEVLEHIKRPFEIIEEMGRILKPNGVLYISTPTPHCLTEIAKEIIGSKKVDVPNQHLNLFGRTHLIAYTEQQGMTLEKYYHYKFYLPLPGGNHIIVTSLYTPPLFGYQIIYKFRKN